MNMNEGKIVQVIGPVVDVEFLEESLPDLYNAVIIKENEINLTMGGHAAPRLKTQPVA